MSDEEKKAIDYLKIRLYGNEGCKFIDVAQSDLRIFLNLVENLQKDIENWKKYCDEQENDITLKNNKICDLEFQVEKQSKEIEELKENYNTKLLSNAGIYQLGFNDGEKKFKDKIKAKIEELIKEGNYRTADNPNGRVHFQKEITDYQIEVLQSLLEKE